MSCSHSVPLVNASKPKVKASGFTPDHSPMRTPTLTAEAPGWRSASAWTDFNTDWAMANSCIAGLADPWQLISGQHIHDSGRADAGAHRDQARVCGRNCADDGRLLAERMLPHGGEHSIF